MQSASDTPSSHCGRCGAPLCGASLRPQDGPGSKRLSPLPESRRPQDAPAGYHEGKRDTPDLRLLGLWPNHPDLEK